MKRLIKTAVTTLVLAGANMAFAELATLNSDQSSVSFVTTKVQDIQEVMRFDQLSGSISDEGDVVIRIHANSINTMIPIRDDRMKEHLFDVADFPVITVSTEIDTDSLEGTSKRELSATLNLLGAEHSIDLNLLVSASGDQITVVSVEPVLVSAVNLGLAEGVAKLGELAGGIWISNSVPVSVALTFDRAD